MEKKTSVLAVLEILQRESDRDHPLTAAQIQQKMEQLLLLIDLCNLKKSRTTTIS